MLKNKSDSVQAKPKPKQKKVKVTTPNGRVREVDEKYVSGKSSNTRNVVTVQGRTRVIPICPPVATAAQRIHGGIFGEVILKLCQIIGINLLVINNKFGIERTDVPFCFPAQGLQIGETLFTEKELLAIKELIG